MGAACGGSLSDSELVRVRFHDLTVVANDCNVVLQLVLKFNLIAEACLVYIRNVHHYYMDKLFKEYNEVYALCQYIILLLYIHYNIINMHYVNINSMQLVYMQYMHYVNRHNTLYYFTANLIVRNVCKTISVNVNII